MSFCGTVGRYDGKFLTLALECIILQKPLMDLADAQYEAKTNKKAGRKSHPTLGAPAAEENGQLKLFPLTVEQREKFTKFAENLRYFLKGPKSKKRRIDEICENRRGLEFVSYEFHVFFDGFKDKELKPAIRMMEKVGRGEPLDDYEPLIKFLSMLNMRALHEHDSYRGGCF